MKYRGAISFLLGSAVALTAGWAGLPRLLYRTEQQPLQFSHKTHSGEKVGMACEDCHSLTDAGYFTGVPALDKCSGCHAEPVTQSADEKLLVEKYVKPEKQIPWLVYARQPQNVRFSHAIHMRRGKLSCETCHGQHGKSERLRPYQENRISGYSRDIWGYSLSRISTASRQQHPPMKMDDCLACHQQHQVSASCRACHK